MLYMASNFKAFIGYAVTVNDRQNRFSSAGAIYFNYVRHFGINGLSRKIQVGNDQKKGAIRK